MRIPVTAAALAAVAALGAGTAAASAAAAATPAAGTPAATQPAGAAPATLQQVQARAASDIAARVSALNAEITKVQAAKDLGADQATLVSHLQADVSGEQQLGQKIAADTTVGAARTDAQGIFTNFRVFALALPVAHMVTAADRATAAVTKLDASAGTLARKVTPATTAQVTPLLDDMTAQAAAAGTATRPLPAQLLALTPAAWNADHGVLAAPHTALTTAGTDLKKAVADRKQAVADLRAAHAGHHAKATTPAPAAPTTTPAG